MAQERHFTPPYPQSRPTRYKCTNCGHIIPKDDPRSAPALPERCPNCGASKEALFLVEED
jgi:rubrerythrin